MRSWISAERLSDLIGMIYECAVEPAQWPKAMEAMRVELECGNSALTIQSLPDFATIMDVHVNIPEQYARLIAASGEDIADQWGGAERIFSHPTDQPAILSRLNPEFDPATTTNRYYLDFARPQGLLDVLAVVVARDAQALGSIAFGRHESAGPFGDREAEIARLLVPHLQRAATINRMLDLSALATASFAAVVDRLGTPVVMTDDRLRIAHANPAATVLLDQGDLLTSRTGRLRAEQPGVEQALAVAVAAAMDRGGMDRKGLEIPARTRDGAAWVLHVVSLPVRQGARLGGAQAAIFIGQARTGFIASDDLLAALFGLTPTEARVFQAIAAGHEPGRIAEQLGVAPSTIKTHLHHLFAKTGAHRQADLVQIAASLATPLQ